MSTKRSNLVIEDRPKSDDSYGMDKLAAEAASGTTREDNWVARWRNLLNARLPRPEDITEAVSLLVSDRAKWIRGGESKVDAGFSLL